MKETLLNNWGLMRILRLVMGTLMMYQFYITGDKIVVAIGAVLLYQALFNKGCCANNACAPKKTTNSQTNNIEDIVFEEVK